MQMGGMHHIGLHHQVVVDEISRVGVVGVNATNFGRREVHLRGPLLVKQGLHCRLVTQVQLGVGSGDELLRAKTLGQ
jgi:hypothetical protein